MNEFREMVWDFVGDMKATRKLGKKNKVPLLASSVAFFSIFSLGPLLVVCYITSRFLLRTISSAEQEPADLQNVIESILPSMDPTMAKTVLEIVRQNAVGNLLNFCLLAWSGYELFGVLHYAFDQISERTHERNAFITNLISVVCFSTVVGVSSILLIISTVDSSILLNALNQELRGLDILSFKMLTALFGTISLVGAITVVYKLMPTQKIRTVHAFRGSVVFLMLFILGRSSYQLYASYYKMMNEGMFGPFFTFVMVIVWIYFLSRAFLFSAQYVIYLEEKEIL